MEILNIFMTVAFVFFMVFMIRGFMLQSAKRDRDKIEK